MDRILEGFLTRNVPHIKDNITIDIVYSDREWYELYVDSGVLHITASTYIAACNGLYNYLKKYLRVQLSWCGNSELDVREIVPFDGKMTKTIEEKYRVYMNYCTLNYSMSWWDYNRWEREIDFMALNGINMPLGVIGSEAVWYETLLEFGFSEAEALSTISGPAFMAWQWMTNIEGYMPPTSTSYVRERLELGRAILARMRELGMVPIMQGFAGHVPVLMKKKYPHANIRLKKGWCGFPSTAEIDPLDPLFNEFGMAYLKNMERLLGNSHYIACDPFHEGTPPKSSRKYLANVGASINRLYETFDKESTWVMQGWTPRPEIIKAVPQDRLLLLDLPSDRSTAYDNFYGYPTVSGMLHNFGGKNAMQGQIARHANNAYKRLKDAGVNVVGSGMFMEGIEQNPVVYDLQFTMLTESDTIDYDSWLRDYIDRRYGGHDDSLHEAWSLLMDTCYRDKGYNEIEVGSTVTARPHLMPKNAGPCCYTDIWYDTKKLEHALMLFASVSDRFNHNDGYQYDLCDITRQVLSNRFHDNELLFKEAYKSKDIAKAETIAKVQLEILDDMDELLSHRSEMCLDRWLCMAQRLATSEAEARYFDRNGRTLITLWGNISDNCYALYDYSWREWSGLIKDYYRVRWEMFYTEAIRTLKTHKRLRYPTLNGYAERRRYMRSPLGRHMNDYELAFLDDYKPCTIPTNTDVLPSVNSILSKYSIV